MSNVGITTELANPEKAALPEVVGPPSLLALALTQPELLRVWIRGLFPFCACRAAVA